MASEDVLAAPQEWQCWHRQQQPSVIGQHLAPGGERGGVLVEVLQDIQRAQQVDRTCAQRRRFGVPQDQLCSAALPAAPQRLEVGVQDRYIAALGQDLGVGAEPRADVEDASIAPLRYARAEDPAKDAAARTHPPVVLDAVPVFVVYDLFQRELVAWLVSERSLESRE